MAEPLRPTARKTFGKTNWIFVPTLSSQASPPVADVNSATGIDVTRIVFASTGTPTQSTNRVTNERRLGDTKTYEFIGISNVTGGDMLYAFDDQAAALSDGKKFYEKIPEGTTGYLIERRGLGRAVTPAAGQFVNVYPVEFGPSFPASAGDAESAEAAMTVTFAVTGDPSINVAIAA